MFCCIFAACCIVFKCVLLRFSMFYCVYCVFNVFRSVSLRCAAFYGVFNVALLCFDVFYAVLSHFMVFSCGFLRFNAFYALYNVFIIVRLLCFYCVLRRFTSFYGVFTLFLCVLLCFVVVWDIKGVGYKRCGIQTLLISCHAHAAPLPPPGPTAPPAGRCRWGSKERNPVSAHTVGL